IESLAAIAIAGLETGVDFDLLVMKAIMESRLGVHNAPLQGGNARCLFHFMPARWLVMLHRRGDRYMDGIYAPALEHIRFDGREPYVANPAVKAYLLSLRSDPSLASFMKAQQILHDARPVLRTILGREPGYTDYYIVHFLGIPRTAELYRFLKT